MDSNSSAIAIVSSQVGLRLPGMADRKENQQQEDVMKQQCMKIKKEYSGSFPNAHAEEDDDEPTEIAEIEEEGGDADNDGLDLGLVRQEALAICQARELAKACARLSGRRLAAAVERAAEHLARRFMRLGGPPPEPEALTPEEVLALGAAVRAARAVTCFAHTGEPTLAGVAAVEQLAAAALQGMDLTAAAAGPGPGGGWEGLTDPRSSGGGGSDGGAGGTEEGIPLELLVRAGPERVGTLSAALTCLLRRTLRPSNCFARLLLARRLACSELEEAALLTAVANFSVAVRTDKAHFLQLDVGPLLAITSNSNLQVSQELDVWHAIAEWVVHSREARRPFLYELLLGGVRLSDLDTLQLSALQRHSLLAEPGPAAALVGAAYSARMLANVHRSQNRSWVQRTGGGGEGEAGRGMVHNHDVGYGGGGLQQGALGEVAGVSAGRGGTAVHPQQGRYLGQLAGIRNNVALRQQHMQQPQPQLQHQLHHQQQPLQQQQVGMGHAVQQQQGGQQGQGGERQGQEQERTKPHAMLQQLIGSLQARAAAARAKQQQQQQQQLQKQQQQQHPCPATTQPQPLQQLRCSPSPPSHLPPRPHSPVMTIHNATTSTPSPSPAPQSALLATPYGRMVPTTSVPAPSSARQEAGGRMGPISPTATTAQRESSPLLMASTTSTPNGMIAAGSGTSALSQHPSPANKLSTQHHAAHLTPHTISAFHCNNSKHLPTTASGVPPLFVPAGGGATSPHHESTDRSGDPFSRFTSSSGVIARKAGSPQLNAIVAHKTTGMVGLAAAEAAPEGSPPAASPTRPQLLQTPQAQGPATKMSFIESPVMYASIGTGGGGSSHAVGSDRKPLAAVLAAAIARAAEQQGLARIQLGEGGPLTAAAVQNALMAAQQRMAASPQLQEMLREAKAAMAQAAAVGGIQQGGSGRSSGSQSPSPSPQPPPFGSLQRRTAQQQQPQPGVVVADGGGPELEVGSSSVQAGVARTGVELQSGAGAVGSGASAGIGDGKGNNLAAGDGVSAVGSPPAASSRASSPDTSHLPKQLPLSAPKTTHEPSPPPRPHPHPQQRQAAVDPESSSKQHQQHLPQAPKQPQPLQQQAPNLTTPGITIPAAATNNNTATTKTSTPSGGVDASRLQAVTPSPSPITSPTPTGALSSPTPALAPQQLLQIAAAVQRAAASGQPQPPHVRQQLAALQAFIARQMAASPVGAPQLPLLTALQGMLAGVWQETSPPPQAPQQQQQVSAAAVAVQGHVSGKPLEDLPQPQQQLPEPVSLSSQHRGEGEGEKQGAASGGGGVVVTGLAGTSHTSAATGGGTRGQESTAGERREVGKEEPEAKRPRIEG